MGKIDKFKNSVKQGKRFLIVIAVIWLILAILLVAPIAVAWAEAPNGSNSDILTNFVEYFVKEVTSFTTFFRMFGYKGAFVIFLKCLIPYTIAFVAFSIRGFWRTKPKGKYYDIEHGSSDWSVKGEQYKILSPDKGIILAKENYLPVDKRGNVNTLIVRRFRIW